MERRLFVLRTLQLRLIPWDQAQLVLGPKGSVRVIGALLLARQKLTQCTVAAKLGISIRTHKNWEAGATRPLRSRWPALQALLFGENADHAGDDTTNRIGV